MSPKQTKNHQHQNLNPYIGPDCLALFHTNFTIFEPVDLAFHLLFIETSYVRQTRSFANFLPKHLPNLFLLDVPDYQNDQKIAQKKNLRRSQFSNLL